MGFEPITSAIPVQCSANRAIEPSGKWAYLRSYYELPKLPAPSSIALIAHFVEHCTGIAEVMGSYPFKA